MRIAHVKAETLNLLHSSTRFFGGNREALKDKSSSKLHDELTDLYKRYYSANLMVQCCTEISYCNS